MTRIEKFAHGWIELAEGLVLILSLGYAHPMWGGSHYEACIRAMFKRAKESA